MAQRDSRIDAYIARQADFARPILEYLREVVHEACPAVEETLKWSAPSFVYAGGILCSMAAFKQHASFGFWKHALVAGATKPLDGMPRDGMLREGMLREGMHQEGMGKARGDPAETTGAGDRMDGGRQAAQLEVHQLLVGQRGVVAPDGSHAAIAGYPMTKSRGVAGA